MQQESTYDKNVKKNAWKNGLSKKFTSILENMLAYDIL